MERDKKAEQKAEQKALNCPKTGDVWSEVGRNYTYVCDASDGWIKAIFLWGGGREAFLFTVEQFQNYLMYDSSPLNGVKTWTWANFNGNNKDQKGLMSAWNEEVKENGITEKDV